jgi:hypothetical protein
MALTQIELGMLKDGILTADTAGRLKMADGFVNTAKLLDANVTAAKVADAAITRTKMGYAGAVLQVVTATKTNATLANATANTWSEPDTGFRVSITPTSSSSKFLLFMHISGGSLTGCPRMRFEYSTNGGSSWGLCGPIGDARGSRTQSHCSIAINNDGNVMSGTSAEILFAPATASAMIFRVMFGADQPNYLGWNMSRNDSDSFLGNTMTSTLRVMEIAQ